MSSMRLLEKEGRCQTRSWMSMSRWRMVARGGVWIGLTTKENHEPPGHKRHAEEEAEKTTQVERRFGHSIRNGLRRLHYGSGVEGRVHKDGDFLI